MPENLVLTNAPYDVAVRVVDTLVNRGEIPATRAGRRAVIANAVCNVVIDSGRWEPITPAPSPAPPRRDTEQALWAIYDDALRDGNYLSAVAAIQSIREGR